MPKVKKVSASKEAAIVNALRAKWGDHAAKIPAIEAARAEMSEYIPTGIDVLDHYILARGGLPVGRYSEVYGDEGCGKTSIGYAFLASVQQMGGVAVHVDIEQSFDETRAIVYGVDTESLVVVDFAENLDDALEQVKDTLNAHDPDNGPLGIVYDSIASSKTKQAMKMKAGEKQPAREAALLSEEMPKILQMLSAHRAHLMMLNQTRTKLGVMFGDNTSTPGGRAPGFYSSVRLRFFGGKAIKNAREEHVGKVVTISAAKNRLAPPLRKARVRLDYDYGWNNVYSTLEHAKRMGVITPREKGFKGKGKDSLEAFIEACERLGWPCDEARAKATIAQVKGTDSDADTEADSDD